MAKVDMKARQWAGEAIRHAVDFRTTHEIWRACFVHKAGLTPKEIRYTRDLLRRHKALNEELIKYRDRLEGSSRK